MDSFFSLFDPSDGNPSSRKRNKSDQDNVKKKGDAPKGRRRGRKSQGKNETLPEESSFLCEPELSNELLVKDGSYIESYIEVNRRNDDTKTDTEKKPKRRNSSRKNRRKKNKVSPAKDLVPNTAWNNEEHTEIPDTTNWNNQSSIPKVCDGNIGKNVNDLRVNEDYKKNKRKHYGTDNKNNTDMRNNTKNNTDTKINTDTVVDTKNNSDTRSNIETNEERAVYNVIDKLEKVSLKDDTYLAGDFNTEDLENDFFYSSDDMEEPFDDTTSELEDSSDEAYGTLPPEPRFGNVEYKLQLVSPCERRFQHLVTQLKWRLRSGGGSAVYVLGVRDCGALRGLRARALRGSLYTLRRMATALSATLTHVTARRVAPHRAVAEVYIRKLADTQQSVELRVAVMGANEAGKSTLIGVLTQGELDNGRGSARLNMFRHLHEVKSGRTSSLSHEILGFDAQGNVVNYGCSELMTAERIGERSAKLVSFLDLAGHSKYQRTTLHGLTGYSPHYAMLVISATAGITRITEEHIGLLLALDMPFFTVITKCELAATAVHTLIARLANMLVSANKRPLLITDENLARNCVAPQQLILDTIDTGGEGEGTRDERDESEMESVPVFPVSCVRGVGLSALHAYLLQLQPPGARGAAGDGTADGTGTGTGDPHHDASEDRCACEFQIDEIFHVGASSGPVVGGLLARGQLREGDNLIIGPLDNGSFVPTCVRTVYRNRVQCGSVRAGQSASLGLAQRPPGLRPGMVLLAEPERPPAGAAETGPGAGPGAERRRPTFGTCAPGARDCNNKNEVTELVRNRQQHLNEKSKNNKNAGGGGGGLLRDIESTLAKGTLGAGNVYRGGGCTCGGQVLLEDPSDPRGCMFFQATVRVLRHSTSISRGFQCTVHVGNVRQTAIIEGIMSREGVLRAGEAGPALFRFARCPEYLVRGRRMLFTAGLGTRAIGRVTQIFPHVL